MSTVVTAKTNPAKNSKQSKGTMKKSPLRARMSMLLLVQIKCVLRQVQEAWSLPPSPSLPHSRSPSLPPSHPPTLPPHCTCSHMRTMILALLGRSGEAVASLRVHIPAKNWCTYFLFLTTQLSCHLIISGAGFRTVIVVSAWFFY